MKPRPEYHKRLLSIGLKRCRVCKQKKALDQFGIDNSRVDGLYPVCRLCRHRITPKPARNEERKKYEREYKRAYRARKAVQEGSN